MTPPSRRSARGGGAAAENRSAPRLPLLAVALAGMLLPAARDVAAQAGAPTLGSAASCVGAERALRSSAAGDLARGAFGRQQAERARARQPFGQHLKDWFPSPRDPALDDCLRLNQIQLLGSHNSYHVQPSESADLLIEIFAVLSDELPDDLALTLQYTHRPLSEQLTFQGVRQIELDVFDDPEGGLYAEPRGPVIVELFNLPPGPDFDPEGLMAAPGLKVLHVQDVDFRSTCLTLRRCLERVREWSADNPGHLPLMVLVEAKDEPIPDPGFGFVRPLEFGREALDRIDAEIRSVFPPAQLLTPDDVRGGRATLEEAILLDGWPPLGAVRGRVMFALDNGGEKKALYLDGHPALAGRVMFTSSPPGEPEAAFVKLNDPIANQQEIRDLVAAGFLVRTRADADTVEARTGDPTRRDAALASGAQFVSTDYPGPDSNPFGTGYFVEMPGGSPARCNPVSAPPGCDSSRLERLAPTP